MKLKKILFLLIILFGTSIVSDAMVLIEAESFDDYGGWVLDQQFMDQMGSPFLLAHGLGIQVNDATTKIIFPETGKYRVWVRTRDWVAPWKTPETPESQKAIGTPGKFQVIVNGETLKTTFGTEGLEWHWQDGGSIEIIKSEVNVVLHDLTGFEGRCDAILFSKDQDFIPPNKDPEMAQFRRQLLGIPEEPIDAGEYDLVVVGGGIAGICTALSAARNGVKVALVQDRPVLGGNNSSEIRVWMGGSSNNPKYPNVGVITREVNPQGSVYKKDDNIKEMLIRSEENISLFLSQRVNKVEMDGSRIKALISQNIITGKRYRFTGRLFADCTGDGCIGYLAGADHEMTEKGHMGQSNLWRVKDTGSLSIFPRCPWAYDLSNKPFPGRDNYTGQFTGEGISALGVWFWESGFYHHPINDRELSRDNNFRAMYGAWDCLKNVDNQYPTYKLYWAAYISGSRESRRLLGDVLLTKTHILENNVFDDGCVPTSWAIDLHLPHEEYVKDFEGNAFVSWADMTAYQIPYYVPYRCLYSRNISNLFMAGRNISVTHEALGTVRVQRTTGMMGEVVGMAASICSKHNVYPQDIYNKYLDELIKMMSKILFVDNADSNFTSGPSEWPWSSQVPGGYNKTYQYALPGDGSKWAKWTFQLNSSGNCEVFAQWTAHDNRSTAAPYTINNNGTEWTVTVDQTINGGRFMSLGTYFLEAGTVEVVLNDTSTGCVIADAVKIVFEGDGARTLNRIEIVGPSSIDENSGANFDCRAFYSNDTDGIVSADSWSEDCSSAEIDASGHVTTYEVTANEICHVTAYYTEDSVQRQDSFELIIRDTDTLLSEVIIDNGDVGFSSAPSEWPWSSQVPGGYNKTYQYALPGDGSKWAKWTFQLNSSGNCEVFAQWTAHDNRSTAAPYTINNNGTEWTVTVDQTINGGRFMSLGTYFLEAGTVEVVLNDTSTGCVIADAVKIVFEGDGARTLSRIEIVGPSSIDENSGADFVCRAFYSDGTDGIVSVDSWSEDCSSAEIDASGQVTTYEVTANEICHVTAYYTEDSVQRQDSFELIIRDTDTLLSEVIIDNGDVGFSSAPSEWPWSSHVPGGYNKTYQYALPGDGSKWAKWTFQLNSSGNCEVFAQWTAHDNRSTAAPYTINNNGTEWTVTVDQTINGGRFMSLGTYFLEAGTVEVVLNDTSTGCVIADAVKIVFEGDGERTLSRIEIVGPSSIDENSVADFVCRAYYTDGTDLEVSADSWTDTCDYADVDNTGYLTTFELDANEECQITASYTAGGVTKNGVMDVTIKDTNASEMIIDNGDAGFSSGPNEWSWSSHVPGGYNKTYQYALPGDGSKWAKWTFQLNSSGNCEVFAQWTAHDNRSTVAPYTINNNGTEWTVTVDQTINGGRFMSLGTYFLEAGTVEVLLNDTSTGCVIADAVKVVYEGSIQVTVDNKDTFFTKLGAWGTSSAIPGYYGSNYRYATPDGGDKWAKWTFLAVEAGIYEIYAQWAAFENRSPAAPYTIRNNGTVVGTATADQTQNGGRFNKLGTFDLTAGNLEVVLTDTPTGYVIADAVQVILTGNLNEGLVASYPINKSDSYGELWIDGNLIGTENNIKTVFSSGDLLIGYCLSTDSLQRRYWSGKIDDVRIYNRALSEAEINTLFNLGN